MHWLLRHTSPCYGGPLYLLKFVCAIFTQVHLAHREAVALEVDIDDVIAHDEGLGKAVQANTKRYSNIFSEVVQELLPVYRDKQVAEENCRNMPQYLH